MEYNENKSCIYVDPVNDSSRDWVVASVQDRDFVTSIGHGVLRRYKAYNLQQLAPTLTLVVRFPVDNFKWDHGGREGDDFTYRGAFKEFLEWNIFDPQTVRLDKVNSTAYSSRCLSDQVRCQDKMYALEFHQA